MDFRKLIVWQKAMDMTVHLYAVIDSLPAKEIYALSSQMRRAAVSIPSNIAEGSGRASSNDKKHFFAIARGSSSELQTQLLICGRLGYLDDTCVKALCNEALEIQKILSSLIDKDTLR